MAISSVSYLGSVQYEVHFSLSALLPNGSTNDDKVGHVEKKYTDQERYKLTSNNFLRFGSRLAEYTIHVIVFVLKFLLDIYFCDPFHTSLT